MSKSYCNAADNFYRVVNELLRDTEKFFLAPGSSLYPIDFPPMDIWINSETKDLVMEFAVAGIPKEAFSIEVNGDKVVLYIDTPKKEKEGYKLIQNGIKVSPRTISLPIYTERWDKETIKSSLKDGILTITVQAKEEAKPKKIAIE